MNLFRGNLLAESLRFCLLAFGLTLVLLAGAKAQTCYTADDMDAATHTALTAAGKHYFDLVSKGDAAALKQSAIASLAGDFSSVETAVKDNQSNLSGTQPTPRPEFLLKVEGTAPLERAEFLCGVFGKNGQTANSAEFVIPSLAPGTYSIAIEDASTLKGPYVVTFVLQQQGTDWKLGGLFVKAAQAAGKDANWYAGKARAFKEKGQNHNAWFYYEEARDLAVPVPFMYTQVTDRIFDESETVTPTDLPGDGTTVDLTASGTTYKLTAIFPLAVAQDFDLVVKYQLADVSNTSKTYDTNMAVIKALVAKYPEFRDGFAGVVARAVEPSGKDYGTLAEMKDIK
jgi:hypothetical protein